MPRSGSFVKFFYQMIKFWAVGETPDPIGMLPSGKGEMETESTVQLEKANPSSGRPAHYSPRCLTTRSGSANAYDQVYAIAMTAITATASVIDQSCPLVMRRNVNDSRAYVSSGTSCLFAISNSLPVSGSTEVKCSRFFPLPALTSVNRRLPPRAGALFWHRKRKVQDALQSKYTRRHAARPDYRL